MNEESRPQGPAPKSTPTDYFKNNRLWPLSRHDAHRERLREAHFQMYVEPEPQSPPSSFGMTAEELRAEAERLQTQFKFQPWEIRARLANPNRVAA